MLSINTNLSSLITQHSMKSATQLLNQAVERMTTGYKINHAKDNAANYSIATNLTTKINSYLVAEENCAMGLDLLATANGSLNLISDKLTRLRDLATQASNGTYGQQSLNAINAEANALVDEVNKLFKSTEYNGRKLFSNEEEMSINAVYSKKEVAAMTPITDEVTTFNSGEKYSISNKEELLKFVELVNSGVSTSGVEFVLGADIDLSSIANWTPIGVSPNYFRGIFEGNGHTISNLTITGNSNTRGFFYKTEGATIQNLILKDVDIEGGNIVGSLVAQTNTGSKIINCAATGSVSGSGNVGGLIGYQIGDVTNCYTECSVTSTGSGAGGLIGSATGNIDNSYSSSIVNGTYDTGGFIGYAYSNSKIKNCFSTGDVNGQSQTGGFIGTFYRTVEAHNCFTTSNVSGDWYTGGFVGHYDTTTYTLNNCISLLDDQKVSKMSEDEILSLSNLESMGFIEDEGWTIMDVIPLLSWQKEAQPFPILGCSNKITLQIGINSDLSSQLNFDIGFILGAVDVNKLLGNNKTINFISKLDNMLSTVSAKQTEFGAVENRLESALESISVNIENLTSSLSTIRDADIAEVSSEYIRQQILQQASATLMATANQSPAIALQLI